MFKKIVHHSATRSGLLFLATLAAVGLPAVFASGQAVPANKEIRAKLADILARPEFAASRWAEGFVEQAGRFIAGVMSRLFSRTADGKSWPYLVLFICFIAVCFVLFYAGSRLFRAFSPEQARDDDPIEDLRAMDDTALRGEADRCAETGQFREAVRYLYLSLLLFLDRRELIRFRMSKTNREYLRELKNSGACREGFADMVAVFERKWYGMEACDGDDYRRFREVYMGMVAMKEG